MAARFSLFVRLSQDDLDRCMGILIYKYLCYIACSLSIYLSILIYNYLGYVLLYTVQLMDATATLNEKTFVLLAVGIVSLGLSLLFICDA